MKPHPLATKDMGSLADRILYMDKQVIVIDKPPMCRPVLARGRPPLGLGPGSRRLGRARAAHVQLQSIGALPAREEAADQFGPAVERSLSSRVPTAQAHQAPRQQAAGQREAQRTSPAHIRTRLSSIRHFTRRQCHIS